MATRKVTVIPSTINPLTRISNTTVKKRRTAGYARVSTDKDEQFTSYEAQILRRLTEKCQNFSVSLKSLPSL